MTAGSGVLRVPLGWWTAEYDAEKLISAEMPQIPQGTFGFRATRNVLALTLLLAPFEPSNLAGAGIDPSLLVGFHEHAVTWALWCRHLLDHPPMGLGAPDRDAGETALEWLCSSRLPANWPHRIEVGIAVSRPGAGLSVGVSQARRVLKHHGDRLEP